MPSQNVVYDINVNLDTAGGYCQGPDGETDDFNTIAIVQTCPESAVVEFNCTGNNCSGTTTVEIGYQCGTDDISCGNYSECPNVYEDDINLNCTCDANPGQSDYQRWQDLGGCVEDETGVAYTGCQSKNVSHQDACGVIWTESCGGDCYDDQFTACIGDDSEVDFYGTCTCLYTCPTDCDTGQSCGFYDVGSCNNTNNIQADGGTGDCGSCGDNNAGDPTNCYTCGNNQCCNFKGKSLTLASLSPNTIELGESTNQEFRVYWRRGLTLNGPDNVGNLTIKVRKLSSGTDWTLLNFSTDDYSNCSNRHLNTIIDEITGAPVDASEGSNTNRFRWNPEKFFINQGMTYADIIAGSSNFQIRVEGYITRTINFSILDDVRAGCTDSLAENYVSNATYDDGSCEYMGCTDSEAANYSCGTDGLGNASPNLANSYACGAPISADEGNTGYNYSISDMTDNGLCEFYPISVISHTPSSLSEGQNVTVSGIGSTTYNNGTYVCELCTGNLSYTWTITDTEENDYTEFISDTHTLNFPVPIMVGADQGGGGVISVDLSVTNILDWSSTFENYLINVGDVDIIGTQLSSFPSIYIPGGGAYSLIGSYLPPNETNYNMGDLLNSSFFINNPDEYETEELVSNTYMTGDFAYVILCANEECAGNDENLDNGFFNYITDYGWIGPDIDLKPGMGVKLSTSNAGYFRWTIPEG